jgi:hypothetical protein
MQCSRIYYLFWKLASTGRSNNIQNGTERTENLTVPKLTVLFNGRIISLNLLYFDPRIS